MYRLAAPPEPAHTLVVFGRRSLKPLFVLLFLSPLLILLSRTELVCARSKNECVARTFGILGGGPRSVPLDSISRTEIEDDRGMTRPVLVLHDGKRVPLSPHIDTFQREEKAAFERDLSRYLVARSETFDEGYGPSPLLVTMGIGVVLVIGLLTVFGRERARIVVDPKADTMELTFYLGMGNRPRTTSLEHPRLRANGKKWVLYDEQGASVDLPTGASPRAIQAVRALLGPASSAP